MIDLGRPSGQRVVSVDARCGDCVVPVYQKLNLDANYTVLMTKYLSDGGDDYSFEKLVDFRSLGECSPRPSIAMNAAVVFENQICEIVKRFG